MLTACSSLSFRPVAYKTPIGGQLNRQSDCRIDRLHLARKETSAKHPFKDQELVPEIVI
jgi:hypothetical protein